MLINYYPAHNPSSTAHQVDLSWRHLHPKRSCFIVSLYNQPTRVIKRSRTLYINLWQFACNQPFPPSEPTFVQNDACLLVLYDPTWRWRSKSSSAYRLRKTPDFLMRNSKTFRFLHMLRLPSRCWALLIFSVQEYS